MLPPTLMLRGAWLLLGCGWLVASTAAGVVDCRNSTTPECTRASVTAKATTAVPRAGDEGVFEGPVLWVTDGDSLRALIRGRDTEIRLADVDAPEREQVHGWESKLQLIDLVRDKRITVAPRDVDQYGRIVARIWVGTTDVNRELVARGAAWFYPQYAEDESLYLVEQQARDTKRGLWTLPLKDRMEPWVWRKQQARRRGGAGAGR